MDFALKHAIACINLLNNYVSILVLMDFALKPKIIPNWEGDLEMFQSLF